MAGSPVDAAVDAALGDALRTDAAASPPEHPGPPRQDSAADPDAPHGRDDAGTPLAPFGINKRTKRPNLKPGGPGRGHKSDDKPRVTGAGTTAAAAPAKGAGGQPAAAGRDYSEDLAGFGMGIWMGASAVKGGRLPLIKIPVPDLRPYAYVWHDQLPRGVAAWNTAAQQNAAVRRWVDKLAGEGSWAWVLGVGIWGSNFLAGCQELAAKQNGELRKMAAEANDTNMEAFLAAQLQAAAQTPAPAPAAA